MKNHWLDHTREKTPDPDARFHAIMDSLSPEDLAVVEYTIYREFGVAYDMIKAEQAQVIELENKVVELENAMDTTLTSAIGLLVQAGKLTMNEARAIVSLPLVEHDYTLQTQ